MKIVRVYASPSVDNPEAPRFCVDVPINDDRQIVGAWPIFGMQGSFDANCTSTCYPFVLYEDGTMDFGSGWEHTPGERRSDLDLRDGPIVDGRILTVRNANRGDELYRISRIGEFQLP